MELFCNHHPRVLEVCQQLLATPSTLYNTLLVGLVSTAFLWKIVESRVKGDQRHAQQVKPPAVKSLQWRFLIVFWLLRLADWMQGPYFYEVYSSKIINGVPLSLDLVSKLFLVGFATTGIFGPYMGRFVDSVGRRAGSLLYTVLYSLSALSTQSSHFATLLAGRLAGGLGTSLLSSAPEAWYVAEHNKLQAADANVHDDFVSQTFGWAYAGDSIVAILAGQLASYAATKGGPSAPFTVSVGFLVSAAVLMLLKWSENVAKPAAAAAPVDTKKDASPEQQSPASPKASIMDGVRIMLQDKRILLLGAVQALFEGAMYIFVLQWPPAMKTAIQAMKGYSDAAVPYGTIFSCFMASCLLGSSLFSTVQKHRLLSVEAFTGTMLALATTAMAASTFFGLSSLPVLTAAFFLFEACVGMYFPGVGTLRSKYLPNSHRSIIMNLFGLPLNLIVISVFLNIHRLGTQGALTCATIALAIATISMAALGKLANHDDGKKKTA
eukprot:scaffold6125_cov262-Ochromonas_danica.AAC.8